jgi:hypothetical protein
MNDSMTGSMVLVSTLFPWNAETMSGKPVPVLIGEQPHSDLRPLSGDLQHWYFAQGVMFLTEESRDAYFAFRTPSRAWSRALLARIRHSMRRRVSRSGRRVVCSAPHFELPFKGFPRM